MDGGEASSNKLPYWSYDDIGLFLLFLPPLGGILRLGIQLGALQATALARPSLGVQIGVILYLIMVLYAILKVR